MSAGDHGPSHRRAASPAQPTPWQRVSNYRDALQHGHRYRDSDTDHPPEPYWHAKPGSHDDGELSGLFLGGIGAPVVGRDLDGSFARWHLQNGYHLRQPIDSAFFALRWAEAAPSRAPGTSEDVRTATAGEPRSGYFRLAARDAGSGATAGQAVERTVYSLFPVIHEHYRGDALPLEVVLELWTPLFNEAGGRDETSAAGSRSTASWPVWFATITVANRGDRDLEVDTAAFWPNVLGWRAAHATALDQPARPWP
ncbi:MAG: GH116 family glycosyl-hydrolase, partial [Alkalispirochaeta sp.]